LQCFLFQVDISQIIFHEADEPLASLDRARREEVMAVIKRVREELKLPILYVSHDRADIERLATTIVPICQWR
jgi:ABC-type molybdate transport system ATPase subunit